jgi:hypothetical protein
VNWINAVNQKAKGKRKAIDKVLYKLTRVNLRAKQTGSASSSAGRKKVEKLVVTEKSKKEVSYMMFMLIVQILDNISNIFFEADKPPKWLSFVKAGLVIVGAETFGKFSGGMFEYLLQEEGSG